MIRIPILAALLLSAAPALAQESPGHTDRAEEDQVRGMLRREAENEFSANDPTEAQDTCRELLAHIEGTRWRTPGEMDEQRQWAKACADGTYIPYRRPAPSVSHLQILIESGLDKIFPEFLPLLGLPPYDPKNDPTGRYQRGNALAIECLKLTDYAERYGQGAIGLVTHCEAIAYYIRDRTIKMRKKPMFCLQFWRASYAFSKIDVASSPLRERIETAQRDVDNMLARPECRSKG